MLYTHTYILLTFWACYAFFCRQIVERYEEQEMREGDATKRSPVRLESEFMQFTVGVCTIYH